MHHVLPTILESRALRSGCFAALALVCLLSTGCVRRRMTIRSHPPGAQVFVDDQEIGTTPCSTAYIYYGKRNVMLVKDGYQTQKLVHQFTVPWYEYVPLDFINENLNPNEIRDERTIDVTLVPQENVPPAQLLERANNLRGGARTGMITPLPNVPLDSSVQPNAVLPKFGLPGEGLPGGQPIPYQSLPVQPLPNAGQAIEPPPNSGPPDFNLPNAGSGTFGPPASPGPPFVPAGS